MAPSKRRISFDSNFQSSLEENFEIEDHEKWLIGIKG